MPDVTPREVYVNVTSMVGANTRQPLVVLTIHGHEEARVDLPVEAARAIALQLLECAEAAQTDAIGFDLYPNDMRAAAQFMMLLRERREAARAPKQARRVIVEDGPTV